MPINKSSLLLPATIFLLLSGPFAAGQTLSNERVVISAVRSAVDGGLSGDSTAAVRVVSDEEGLRGIFATGIAEGIMNKFSRVMIAPSPDTNSLNLFFEIYGFDFDYGKGGSRGFLRARRIRRQLGCELSITMKSGVDGTLLDIKRLAVSYGDEVEPSSVRVINSRHIPELAPEAPGSGWSRYAEPSLVIATVGVLVYMFFANR